MKGYLSYTHCVNYSRFLNKLADNGNLPVNVNMGAAGIIFSSIALQSHDYLETTKGWTITGDEFNTNCSLTVPVTLSGFKAVYKAPFTVISWTTGVADDLAYFEVQVSLDGTSYKTVRKIAKQTGNPNYSCQIHAPADMAYYRLKVFELTGKVSYSSTRAVSTSLSDAKNYTLYPNPVQGNTLHVRSSKATTSEVAIYNQLGQQVGLYQLVPGENSIHVGGLASGVYWLRETVGHRVKGVEPVAPLNVRDPNGDSVQSPGEHLKFIIRH